MQRVYFRAASGEGFLFTTRSEARVLEHRQVDLQVVERDEALKLIRRLPNEPRGRRAYWQIYSLLKGKPVPASLEASWPPGTWRLRDAMGHGCPFSVYQLPEKAQVPGWGDQHRPVVPKPPAPLPSPPPTPLLERAQLSVVSELRGQTYDGLRFEVKVDGRRSRRTVQPRRGLLIDHINPSGSWFTHELSDDQTYANTLEVRDIQFGIPQGPRPTQTLSSPVGLALIEHVKLQGSDTPITVFEALDEIAARYGLSGDALRTFNYGADLSREALESAFRVNLGCILRDERGHYLVDPGLDPGIVLVPKPIEEVPFSTDRQVMVSELRTRQIVVRDPMGLPIPGLRLTVLDGADQIFEVTTGTRGVARVQGVEPGPLEVTVEGPETLLQIRVAQLMEAVATEDADWIQQTLSLNPDTTDQLIDKFDEYYPGPIFEDRVEALLSRRTDAVQGLQYRLGALALHPDLDPAPHTVDLLPKVSVASHCPSKGCHV